MTSQNLIHLSQLVDVLKINFIPNFEKVCTELGAKFWKRRRLSGIWREFITDSWTNDEESSFASLDV